MTDLASQMQVPGAPDTTTPPAKPRKTGKHPALAAPYGKKKKKAKKRKAKRTAPKEPKARRGRSAITLDLGGAVELLSSMHRTDVPVFRKLSELITGQGAPSRKRILVALNKVFG